MDWRENSLESEPGQPTPGQNSTWAEKASMYRPPAEAHTGEDANMEDITNPNNGEVRDDVVFLVETWLGLTDSTCIRNPYLKVVTSRPMSTRSGRRHLAVYSVYA
jgi:hypothetical protein